MSRFFFVGRRSEKLWFEKHLSSDPNKEKIINVYGTGGIGKSTLLDEFKCMASRRGIPFILLESKEFRHTPAGLLKQLTSSLSPSSSLSDSVPPSLSACAAELNRYAEPTGLYLAFDTYEEWNQLDRFIRESLIPELSDRIHLILSGRYPLSGDWITRPSWVTPIKRLQLQPFEYETCEEYAAQFERPEESAIRRMYLISRGHPLTFSLLIGFSREGLLTNSDSFLPEEAIRLLTARWLREVPDDGLIRLAEASSLVRVFNHELLEFVVGETVSAVLFNRFIQLSFIRRNARGWYIHDVLRKAVYEDFRKRKPQTHRQWRERCMVYLYRQLPDEPSDDNALLYSDFIYLLDNPVIRSVYLLGQQERQYTLETVTAETLGEVRQHIQDVLDSRKDFYHVFFDPLTHERIVIDIPSDFDQRAFRILNPEAILAVDEDAIHAIRNDRSEITGLLVLISIHSRSLPFLIDSPISKHFFRHPGNQHIVEAARKSSAPIGGYFYHVDLRKDNSPDALALTFQFYISAYMKGGIFVASFPLPHYQDFLLRMGFTEQPEIPVHYDFGDRFPSPTYVMDLSGQKFKSFMKRMMDKMNIPVPAAISQWEQLQLLTPREQEIASLMLAGKSIKEIAESCYITEIAVKKHLGRIYHKLGVKNKVELLSKWVERPQ
ncbi:hypothetical protein GE107_13255 [Cohnella sp. CFH 77786]|uniref:response regulator transcription factor n=1 Tax=Cohnella sp. CFH 77786 TaxID=2662265 RepID=UPI001C60815C|nr:helix-turn-helix transcriptional regulator [Cohnella sp. CFH 77786]MBW5447030.1 hypothetical protein [Cohnella sp. CFH 77786]